MLEKQRKLFVQGYNLEVHDVIKYTQKYHATVIKQKPQQAIVTFEGEIHTLLWNKEEQGRGKKDKRNRHDAVGKSSSEQHFRKSAAITFIM